MARIAKKQLGEIIVEKGLVSKEQLEEALEIQEKEGERLSTILIRLGHVDEKQLAACLAEQMQLPLINLGRLEIDSKVVNIVPEQVARHYKLIPVSRLGKKLTVAMADPLNILAVDDVKLLTGYEVMPVIGIEKEIEETINRSYSGDSLETLLKDSEEGEDVELVEEKK